jgi:hypothetical protein
VGTKVYYKLSYIYTAAEDGKKIKVAIDPSEDVQKPETEIILFDKSLVKAGELELTGDLTVLTFKLDAKVMEAPGAQEFQDTQDLSSINFSDVYYIVVLDKEKRLKTVKKTYTMTQANGLEIVQEISVDVISYNTITQIDFPSDLHSYIDWEL